MSKLIYCVIKIQYAGLFCALPTIEITVKECDATMINSSNAARLRKKSLHNLFRPLRDFSMRCEVTPKDVLNF